MLAQILATADERAIEADAALQRFKSEAEATAPARDFAAALRTPGLSIIAEIKRRSPSAGEINTTVDPVRQAIAYEQGGASAISVLTEPHFFGGSLDDLTAVSSAVSIPVLRKDFTRRPSQIWEARAAGADAVLLIVAALSDAELTELLEVARLVGVTAIVEAHTHDETLRAVALRADVIGVNNRDLHTFATDLSVAEGAAPLLPSTSVRIAESGVSTAVGAARMAHAGYDAILVGEALVRAADPAALVASLRAAS
jgi:indole-3-glycerol phosphate synthase